MTESFAYNYYDGIIMTISFRVPLLVLVYFPEVYTGSLGHHRNKESL